MAARRQMLDEALSIGREELGCLASGDVSGAERLSKSRERILDEAIADLDGGQLSELADKLVEMKSLHDEISEEARRLHDTIRNDLLSIKKQNRRITGYSRGAGNMPMLARQRFVHKKG
ncbi:hypothetical protein [Pseudodesulfovibrio sp.]|uniref:hypothetical protein n=1 Tax=unclassified Pseudodesulfovibrio TaxID=2661612 RepID=UPI003AFFB560